MKTHNLLVPVFNAVEHDKGSYCSYSFTSPFPSLHPFTDINLYGRWPLINSFHVDGYSSGSSLLDMSSQEMFLRCQFSHGQPNLFFNWMFLPMSGEKHFISSQKVVHCMISIEDRFILKMKNFTKLSSLCSSPPPNENRYWFENGKVSDETNVWKC